MVMPELPPLGSCALCKKQRAFNELRRCLGCETLGVCPDCFLPGEAGGHSISEWEKQDIRRCFSCAVPKCLTCGWEAREGTEELSDLRSINPGFVFCPVCRSYPNRLVACRNRFRTKPLAVTVENASPDPHVIQEGLGAHHDHDLRPFEAAFNGSSVVLDPDIPQDGGEKP